MPHQLSMLFHPQSHSIFPASPHKRAFFHIVKMKMWKLWQWKQITIAWTLFTILQMLINRGIYTFMVVFFRASPTSFIFMRRAFFSIGQICSCVFFAMLTPKYKLGKVHKKTQRHPKTMTKISSHILTPKYQRIFSFPPSKKSSSIKTKRDFCHQHWFRSENHKKNLSMKCPTQKSFTQLPKITILA